MSIANSGVHSSSRPQNISDHLGKLGTYSLALRIGVLLPGLLAAGFEFELCFRNRAETCTNTKLTVTWDLRVCAVWPKANFHRVSPYRSPGDEVSLRTTRRSSSTRRHASDHSSLDMCVI